MELKQVEGFSDQANAFDPAAGTTGAMVVERYLVLAITGTTSTGKTLETREKYKIPRVA